MQVAHESVDTNKCKERVQTLGSSHRTVATCKKLIQLNVTTYFHINGIIKRIVHLFVQIRGRIDEEFNPFNEVFRSRYDGTVSDKF